MGQRISIQYSVDIDNLDTEVGRLLRHAHDEIDEIAKDCKLPAEVLSLKTIADLETLREKLFNIDSSLADITQLVGSYVSFKAELAKDPMPPPPVSDESNDNTA